MIYELRVYTTNPGKLQTLLDRFAKTTLHYFNKHGIQPIGFWTDEVGETNRLTYILAYKDMAHREKAWEAWRADPERQKAFAETERDGHIVARVRNTIMRPTSFSPLQ